ncbi:MAG TPA: nuclear transport factor 2 family protein [Terriglobales bacterium]|jgi:beta-aspartyl-peptidase (threonine type)|nr:nuclear transport factor 2 family protein [Terriglobales bacterium]
MRNTALLLSFLLLSLAGLAQATSPKSAIEQVLQSQVQAWNREDLASFMAGYWNSPELTFFSGGESAQGWQQAFDRYKKHYQNAPGQMGKLEFSDLRIESASPDAAFVRGRWHLTLPSGKTPHGLFTLVFRKFPEGWKIIHDHTSAAEP